MAANRRISARSGIVTLAHSGYVATAPHLLYWQRLVSSVTGAIGGAVALVAGVKVFRGRRTDQGLVGVTPATALPGENLSAI